MYEHAMSNWTSDKSLNETDLRDFVNAMSNSWHTAKHLKQFVQLKSRLNFLKHARTMSEIEERIQHRHAYSKTMHYVMDDFHNDREIPY